jgi:hypothetical protein
MSSIDKDLNSLDETMKREIGQLREQLQSHNSIINNFQTQKGQLDQEEREHDSELIDVSKACTTLFEQKSRVFDLLVAENVRITVASNTKASNIRGIYRDTTKSRRYQDFDEIAT